MFRRKNYYLYFLLNCFFISCQPKDSFDWNAGLSAPKYYESSGPFVEYFYQGKSVAGASSGTGADQGWGITSGGYVGGEKFKPIPDSVFVKWVCAVDRYEYEGGIKLPRKKIRDLFQKGYTDSFGNSAKYGLLTAGMAPSGNVTLWLQDGLKSTEIYKFKVKNSGLSKEGGKEQQKIITEIYNSEQYVNSEANIFRYLHGIPYKIWETGEKVYNYDIGFSIEDESTKDYSIAITGYTKDGSLVYSNHDPIPRINWNQNINLEVKSNKKLPVHFYLQWISRDDKQWYEAEIVLPNNLETQLSQFQKQHGKNVFVVVGMDKVLQNEPYTFGRIWLENYKEKIEIMKFRAAKLNVSKTRTKKYEVSKYSIPKGYAFPKWEGREPLTKPADFEYWQEK